LSSLMSGSRFARRRTRAIITTAGALVVAAAFVAPAGAAVSGTHVIAVLPDSSGMELTYPANTPLAVSLIRSGITLSTATVTTDKDGAAAINGGTADCWTGVTPDILAGDTVEITGTGFDDTMVVQGVTSGRPVEAAPGTVVVHGTAPGRPPAAQLEARIIGASADPFDINAKRVLRAGVGQQFVIDYDGPTGDAWTATYPGLSPADVNRALSATDSRGVVLPSLNELTISQNPVVRGPQPPCAAPLLRDAVTSSSPSSVNIATAGRNVVLSGVSQDASSVAVSLDDENSTTAAVTATATPTPASGNQTWTATIPGNQVSGLGDGALTASATYTKLVGPLPGGSLTILKDLSAPAAPAATPSPASGPFRTAQSVTLSDADASAAIHWTNDGSTPNASSPVLAHGAAIAVTSSQTIKAIAIDPAGNAGPVASFAYTMIAPAGGGGSAGGTTTIIQQVPLLLPFAPSQRVQGTRVTSTARPAVHGLSVGVLSGHALRVAMRLDHGAGVVRLRVFRARGGAVTGRPLVSAVRLPIGSGRFVVTLRGSALRSLRRGSYVLEARAGATRGALGTAALRTFRVR
jgi:hypothetical protein